MSKNFKPRLLLQTRTSIKNAIGIDVVHTASNVVIVQKGILIGGGYREYVSAIYEIHGVSNGTPYSIRLYTTYGTGYSLTGFQLDRDGDGITTRWGANLTLSEPDTTIFEKEDRFPRLDDSLVTREDLCEASKDILVKIFDENLINYCDEGNAAPVITILGDALVTVTETDPYVDAGATATDVIDGDVTANIIVGGDTIDTNVVGNYVITYTVSDQFGATAMAVRHVHVVANQPPVVTLVGDSVINIIEGHPYIEEGVVALDNEDGDITADVVISGDTVDTNVPGDYTIEYTITDSHGGVTTLSRIVHIIANDAPVLSLVGTSPMELIQGETYTEPGYNATDTEDGNIAANVTVSGSVDTSTVGVYTLVYSVTDSGGKTTTANRIINVIANTDPVITLLGDSTMEVLNGNAFVDPGFTASDLNQGDLTADVVVAGDTVDTTVDGTYVITYTVEDANGGTGTATRTVSVRTNTAPVITLNGDAEIIMTVGESYVEPGATANDAWDGDLTSGISITGTVDTSTPGNYNITYTVQDSDGVSTSESRLVKVLVNELPTITLIGANAVEVYRTEAFYEPGYSATDAEDGDITNQVLVTPHPLGTDLLGDIMRTYSVTDSNGGSASVTRLVHVIEDEPPTITLLGDNPALIYQGTSYAEAGATAVDYRDGDVTPNIVIGGDVVDPTTPAVYYVSYTVQDSKGHVSVKTRAVTVQANNAPVITLNGSANLEIIENQNYTELSATALDTEDGDVTASLTITGTVNTSTIGEYILTYTATDVHGVSSSITRIVNVIADQPPVITLGGDNPLTVVGGVPYVEPGFTATDDVDGDLTANVVVGGDTVNENLSGTYNLTYTVTAANSASTIVTRVVNVRFAPTITLTGGDMSIATGTPFTDPGYSAFDAEDGDITANIVVSGDTVVPGTPGTYDITYSVTDTDGMVGTASRRVIVSDKPVITLIGGTPKIVKTGDTYTDLGASAFDTEDGNLNASITTTGTVDINTPGTYTITYNVTDSNGISADPVVRTVIVSDQPVITLTGNAAMVLEVNTTFVEPGFTATDTEDGDISNDVVVNSNVNTAVPGDYTITYNVTDSNGIVADTVSRAIKISTRPTIQVLGDNPLAVEFGGTFTDPGYSAFDAEDGNITANVVVAGDTVDTSSVGTYSVTYTVTDSSGLVGVAARLVNVSHAPSLTINGTSPMALAVGEAFTDPGVSASDAEDGDLTANIVVSGDTVDTSTTGTYTIVYTVTDSVGLSTSNTRTVIIDNPPSLTLNGNSLVVVEKGTSYVEPGVTAVDSSGTDITSSIATAGTVDVNTVGNYVLIYTATDANGLSNTITRTVSVSTAPVVTLLGASTTVVVLNDTYTELGATATDAEDGDITANIVTSGAVDTSTVGDYTITYTVQDSMFLSDTKTRTVTVAEAPVIQLIGTGPMTVEQDTTFTDPGATASDPEDGDITDNIVTSGTVDTSTIGSYTVTYTITNSYGIESSISRVVNVKAKPSITLLGTSPMAVVLNGTFTDPGATATDLEDGDISSNIVVAGDTVDTTTLGTYNVTYNVTDADGFSATEVTRTVTVEDKPVITLLGLADILVELGGTFTDPGATASDTEDGDISGDIVITSALDTNTSGNYIIEYNVTDSNGFAADTVSRTVHVTSKPVITLLGDATTHISRYSAYTDAGATASDPEDGDLTANIVVVNNVDTGTIGNYTVTYNVTDNDGMAATEVTRNVEVHAAPLINLVGSNYINIAVNDNYAEPGYTATDEYGNDITADVVVAGDTVDVTTPGTYVVTYNVTDANGIASNTVTRTMVVNALPTITLTGGTPYYVAINTTFTDPGYTANDFEDGDLTANVVVAGDTVDTSTQGTYNVTYTVSDSVGASVTETRAVIVDVPPTITLIRDSALMTSPVYVMVGASATYGQSATSVAGNDITSSIIINGLADLTTIGVYTETLSVVDPVNGLPASVTREVHVVADLASTVVVNGTNPTPALLGVPYTEAGATVTDIVLGDQSGAVVITGSVDTSTAGVYTITYSYQGPYDASPVTATRTVEVTNKPVITLTADSFGNTTAISWTVGTTYVDPGYTANDVEDGDITADVVVGGDVVDTSTTGVYTITYNVTDSNGYAADEVTRTVTVNAPPTITLIGGDMTIAMGSNYTDPGYTASDPEDGDLTNDVVVGGDTVDTSVDGTYTVTYTVTDSAGASVTETRVVTVQV